MIFDAALTFALAAALAYAFADIGARYGVQHAHPFIGSTISRVVSLSSLSVLALIMGAEFPPLGWHYLWVAMGGLFTPGLFALLFMFGISKIGVSRAAPIKGSSPIIASTLAIIFLGERPEWHHLAGVLLVVAGVAVISSGGTGGHWKRIHVLWPIAAAVAAGVGAIFWRKGLPFFPDAIVTPYLVVGGTDSRFYSEISPNLYRFAPFRFSAEDRERIHGTNERVAIETLGRAVGFYMSLIETTAGHR